VKVAASAKLARLNSTRRLFLAGAEDASDAKVRSPLRRKNSIEHVAWLGGLIEPALQRAAKLNAAEQEGCLVQMA